MLDAQKNHIFLIGPRGCGKTSVGRQLAAKLQWDWIDLDQQIQEATGKSIADIFAQHGQGRFRDIESQQLIKVTSPEPPAPNTAQTANGTDPIPASNTPASNTPASNSPASNSPTNVAQAKLPSTESAQQSVIRKVISLGGGAILRPENRQRIQETGLVVLMVAAPEVLVQRIAADPLSVAQRPSLADPADQQSSMLEEMRQMLSLRMPIYQQCADLKLDTTLNGIENVTEQILRWLPRVDPSFQANPPAVEEEKSS